MEQSEWTLAWSDGMGFGIPELDAADRRLSALVNELNQAIADPLRARQDQLQPALASGKPSAFIHARLAGRLDAT
jgi:hypothetical protein